MEVVCDYMVNRAVEAAHSVGKGLKPQRVQRWDVGVFALMFIFLVLKRNLIPLSYRYTDLLGIAFTCTSVSRLQFLEIIGYIGSYFHTRFVSNSPQGVNCILYSALSIPKPGLKYLTIYINVPLWFI